MRKRSFLIMMGLQVEFNHKTTEGIADQAAALDYDVYSYGYLNNRCEDSGTLHGEENIFHLIDPEQFDGFLVRKNSFNKLWARERIQELSSIPGNRSSISMRRMNPVSRFRCGMTAPISVCSRSICLMSTGSGRSTV